MACCYCMCVMTGRGGSPWVAEEDAATRERSRSNTREVDERKPEARGEGKGPSKRESPRPGCTKTLLFLCSFPWPQIQTTHQCDCVLTWHPKKIPSENGEFFTVRDMVSGQAKEEVEALEKKMQQLENELSQTQTNLEQATHNLEEKEKALQNVSRSSLLWTKATDFITSNLMYFIS